MDMMPDVINNPTVSGLKVMGVTPEKNVTVKKCKRCGKILPIGEFQRKGTGRRNICNSCLRIESGASEKFKDFTSRELIDELKSRGYGGVLKKVVTETINL